MAFCGNCGAQINDGARFCPTCGAVQSSEAPNQQQAAPAQAAGPRSDEEKYRYLAALSYLNILFLVLALLVGSSSNYIRHHANQCICLTLWSLCFVIVCIIPFLGWLVAIVGGIAAFVIMIICIVKALKREYYEIPIFGKIRIIPEV